MLTVSHATNKPADPFLASLGFFFPVLPRRLFYILNPGYSISANQMEPLECALADDLIHVQLEPVLASQSEGLELRTNMHLSTCSTLRSRGCGVALYGEQQRETVCS